MKGISAIVAAIILAACINQPFFAASADSAYFYARAETRYAYFYASKSQSSALFTVPYTYCVQVLGEDGDWYYVKYADDYGIYRALYGYCLKDTLTAVNGTPSPVYLYKEVTVTYSADSTQSSLPVLGELTVSAAFYGTFYSGPAAYSYVLCQGAYGYIEGANDDYELVDYQTNDTQADEGATDSQTEDSADGKLIAGIAIAVIAAACVALMLLTGRRRRFAD